MAKASGKLGAYRPAHRTSQEQRHVRALLAVRDSVMRARARQVTLAQALLSREGVRVPTGEPEEVEDPADGQALLTNATRLIRRPQRVQRRGSSW